MAAGFSGLQGRAGEKTTEDSLKGTVETLHLAVNLQVIRRDRLPGSAVLFKEGVKFGTYKRPAVICYNLTREAEPVKDPL